MHASSARHLKFSSGCLTFSPLNLPSPAISAAVQPESPPPPLLLLLSTLSPPFSLPSHQFFLRLVLDLSVSRVLGCFATLTFAGVITQ